MSIVQAIAYDPGFPGAGRVLRELSKVFPGVSYFGQGSETIPTGPFLFLPAWNPNYTAMLRNVTSKVVIVWTSPLLQTEMVPQELEYIAEIRRHLDAGRIYAVWCGSPNTVDLFKGKGFHAPYPVSLPVYSRSAWASVPVHFSLFGPMHPRKNVLAQALAFKLLSQEHERVLHFTDHQAVPIMSAAGIPPAPDWSHPGYVDHGWLPEPSYEKVVQEMEVGLQISVPGVESFSFVCWDHVSRGIPCLTTAPWAPDELKVKDWNNPVAIAAAVDAIKSYNYRSFAEKYARWADEEVRTAMRQLGLDL